MTDAPPADGAGSVIWLASYPKSGNTWLRALLTNYCHPSEKPASINALIGGRIANRRRRFDELLGLDSTDLTHRETLRHRPLFYRLLAGELPRPTFVKTHGAYLRTEAGEALFPRGASAGAVYLARNPLDVAVSFAHHENRPIGWMVERMNDADFVLERKAGGIGPMLPEGLLAWSAHVSGWLAQEAIPVHLVRYEDLHADPLGALAGVLRFAGFAPDDARLRRAVDHAAFPRLRAQEAAGNFEERQPTSRRFFRAGIVGDWRKRLPMPEARKLTLAHGAAMARLGYLRHLPDDLRAVLK